MDIEEYKKYVFIFLAIIIFLQFLIYQVFFFIYRFNPLWGNVGFLSIFAILTIITYFIYIYKDSNSKFIAFIYGFLLVLVLIICLIDTQFTIIKHVEDNNRSGLL
jgi:CDP-diglyceride synthetase